MIKNNLKSFLIHIAISILYVFIFMIFFASQPKWASEEAARNYHNNMIVISIVMIAVAAIVYNSLGRKHLISQGSTYKNLFSVSLTAIVGILIFVNALTIDMIGPSNSLLNSELWQFYSIFNGYALLFIEESRSNSSYVLVFLYLLFSFIPTMAMWAGLQKKRE